jgi:hypothetical protein
VLNHATNHTQFRYPTFEKNRNMIKNLTISLFLIISNLILGQSIDKTKLMGEWQALNVEIPEQVQEKEAVKLMRDAFTGAIFHFQGNGVFNITYGKNADERIEDLFNPSGENWIIEKGKIKLGNYEDGFSSMNITFQEVNGKTYFSLPMMRLEMEKISNDKPSKPKMIKSKKEKIETVDYSKSELIDKEIDESQIIDFKEAENPPLAPECKSKWDVEKRKECTSKYINMHVARKFNTDLATEVDVTGKIRINIEFVIDTNGKPINITANGGPEIMNQNAIEVIGLLPYLKPGTKNGKPVNISYKMPLIFQIEN